MLFEQFVTENSGKLFHLAMKMVESREDAYDIVQETFLKGYKSIENFRGDSSFSSYLYKTASNLCIDFLRKRKKNGISMVISIDDDDRDWVVEIPDFTSSPELALERKELREAIKQAIGLLPPVYRQALILRDISGLSYAQIAEVLDVGEGTVKSRIARARCKMVEILRKRGNLFDIDPSKKAKGEWTDD